MKYNQNSKIMQVKESSLVIGVDIAKKVHYARAFDWRGIELGKVIAFTSDKVGFEKFNDWVQAIKNSHAKEKIIVGFEPTGHYWFTFGEYITKQKYMMVQVNPYHVKKCKELDDNTPSKNDRKDPKTIAMLIKDGRYQIPYIPTGKYAELRKTNNLREDYLKKIWIVKNKVQRWLDMHFPEYNKVFSSWKGKTAIITLQMFGTPTSILEHTAEEILAEWKKEVKRAIGIKRATKLLEIVSCSVGITEGVKVANQEISMLLKEYTQLMEVMEELDNQLEEIVMTIPNVEKLLAIKGIGMKTIAGFLAEVGDISRFNHPKQIIKLAGLNVRGNSSGEHKGKSTISKRGRNKLRALLYRAILPAIAVNEEFGELHKHYTTRVINPLKKKQSATLLCGRLIKVFYVVLTKGVTYEGIKLVENIRQNNSEIAA